jgi:hypothetical protein
LQIFTDQAVISTYISGKNNYGETLGFDSADKGKLISSEGTEITADVIIVSRRFKKPYQKKFSRMKK